LADNCPAVTSINLGNTKSSPTTRTVARQVFLEPEEEQMIRELIDRGIEVEIRPLADDPKIDAASVL
jgi:fructoselysine and glucoselysine-specific PTS system IIB component